MRRIIAVMTVLFAGSCAAFGAFSKDDAGTATAQFLKLGAGARAAALGDAVSAATDDATAVYWNPAGLCRVNGKSASLMHAIWFEDISYDWASYAQKLGGAGTVGVGVQYLSYGSIRETDAAGNELGDFSPNDLAATLSYAKECCGIGLGASAKYISSKIKESASTYAFDFGAQYGLLDRKLMLGAAVQNLGGTMKFVEQEDKLPAIVRVGGAWNIRPEWLLDLDVIAPVDNEPQYGLGTEYDYRIGQKMSLAGRLGYNTRTKDTGGLNGVSAGVGFAYKGYSIDYAFNPYGDLGNTQTISLGVKF